MEPFCFDSVVGGVSGTGVFHRSYSNHRSSFRAHWVSTVPQPYLNKKRPPTNKG